MEKRNSNEEQLLAKRLYQQPEAGQKIMFKALPSPNIIPYLSFPKQKAAAIAVTWLNIFETTE